jgi:POT family proton-dependent oligopeptide transporter
MWGFGSAGVGMLLATVWLYVEEPKLEGRGMPPGREGVRLGGADFGTIAAFVVGGVAAVYGFFALQAAISDSAMSAALKVVGLLGAAGIAYIIYNGTSGSEQWSRVSAILIFTIANIFFWSGFEQAGGTFNLFAAEETNRVVFGYEIAASLFQSVNALAIFIFAPLFASLWVTLAARNMNPSTPAKFGLGLTLLAVGFIVMSFASFAAEGDALISPLWLIGVYVLHTFGELCISPIGLSMVTKLAPPKIVSVMMGLWFASMALANYLAGIMESLLHSIAPDMNLFVFLTISSAVGAALLFALTPLLRKLMRGIH